MNNKITILGAGESGVGAAILAKVKGFDVFVSDYAQIKPKYKKELEKNNIEWEEGKHTDFKIFDAAEIIKSPGISDKTPIIKEIKDRGINIISEIEFAARYTKAKKICITGSNGKTTTTLLVYDILKSAGLNVGLAGNVGQSFARQVAQKKFDYYVLELSSFQLDNMYEFKADIAILLNITPDHLDRYDYKFENYSDAKFRITQNQTNSDYFIFCSDDKAIMQELNKRNLSSVLLPFSLSEKHENGAYIETDKLIIKQNQKQMNMLIDELSLTGKHNTYNSMAAGISAYLLDIKDEVIRESLMNFKGVEHRLEKYLTIRGVNFINDSKGTNVNSVWYALESMKTPVVLILGGIDKGNDYSILYDLVKQKVKTIVAMGLDNSPIQKAFKGIVDVIDTYSIENAVKSAFLLADKGDTVLLSPACASFDLFENYEDRGRKFKEQVRNL
jgi:UDP-N-acetylmuramoylalanine--D-glutamate ligase